ncbi:MAG TPA: ATP-binding protein [Solirubrobacteraceae bacterium]|jgi:anti-sigma regulatory factor (Ser/Thr protein kinase)|nr:ATP-binding protein [Solirubrobacteraceae bacterium]
MTTSSEPALSLDLPCDTRAPGAVRAALSDVDWIDGAAAQVTLIASELVTNAVVHSGCREDHVLAVRAAVSRNRIMISVHDPGLSDEGARPRFGSEGTTGGWGLRIVDELSARWGAQRQDGYRVWAEVPMPQLRRLPHEQAGDAA